MSPPDAVHRVEVAIDRDLCKGTGPCFVVAPRAFRLDDTMKAVVLAPEEESVKALIEAATLCPTQAIYLTVDDRPLYP